MPQDKPKSGGTKRSYQITIDETDDTSFVTVSSTRDDIQTVVWAGPIEEVADPLLSGITAIEETDRKRDET